MRVVYTPLSFVVGSQRQRNLLIPAMRDRISFDFSVVMGAKVREVYRLLLMAYSDEENVC